MTKWNLSHESKIQHMKINQYNTSFNIIKDKNYKNISKDTEKTFTKPNAIS